MLAVNKYKDILLEELYLDDTYQVRRKKDGYLNRFKKGDLACFYVGTNGYLFIQVPKARTTLKKSHLVLLLSNVTIPDNMVVDHIDRDKTNDIPSNLRVVSSRQNNCNRSLRTDNTSGITGIRWSDYHKHYVIRRTVNGKRLSRSRKTLEEAIVVLEELKQLDSDYTDSHGK